MLREGLEQTDFALGAHAPVVRTSLPLELAMQSRRRSVLVSFVSISFVLGCGRMADFEGREGFSSYGDDAGDQDSNDAPDNGEGPISESCYDGIAQPGEVCQVQTGDVPAGIDPCALEVADFDSDGRPDLAVPNSDWLLPPGATHYSHVLRGYGNGNFGDAKPWDSGAAFPVGIAVGDFDGDDDVDIATANHESASAFVLTNEGGMSFDEPIGEQVGATASTIAAGDIDGDGIDDLIVTLPGSIALILNTPAGPSVGGILDLGQLTPMHADLADLDSDGNLDLAVAAQDIDATGQVVIFHGAGDGSFPERVTHPVGLAPWGVTAGDLDGDGDLDLVVSDNGDSTVSLLLGNDLGGFSSRTILPVCPGPQSVGIADMNLDGTNDLVVGCMESDQVQMWLQVGEEGEFELARWWHTGVRPVSVQVADLNLDGVPDIAWANQLSNTVGLVLSQP
jgi:hypothetical protein